MSVQSAILVRQIEEEIRSAGGLVYIPDVIFRVLVEAGYEPGREPSAETVKQLLVAAFRAARRSKSAKNDLPHSTTRCV